MIIMIRNGCEINFKYKILNIKIFIHSVSLLFKYDDL